MSNIKIEINSISDIDESGDCARELVKYLELDRMNVAVAIAKSVELTKQIQTTIIDIDIKDEELVIPLSAQILVALSLYTEYTVYAYNTIIDVVLPETSIDITGWKLDIGFTEPDKDTIRTLRVIDHVLSKYEASPLIKQGDVYTTTIPPTFSLAINAYRCLHTCEDIKTKIYPLYDECIGSLKRIIKQYSEDGFTVYELGLHNLITAKNKTDLK